MFTIYHIPGVKIGCSSELEIRLEAQGFTNYEIIEQHSDIYIASNREMELQKEYGYKVDTVPYWKTIESQIKSRKKSSRIKALKSRGNIKEVLSDMGKLAYAKNKDHWNNCIKKAASLPRSEKQLKHIEKIKIKGKELFLKYSKSRRKPIIAINILTGEETYFESTLQLRQTLNCRNVNLVLNNKRKSDRGYKFRYP